MSHNAICIAMNPLRKFVDSYTPIGRDCKYLVKRGADNTTPVIYTFGITPPPRQWNHPINRPRTPWRRTAFCKAWRIFEKEIIGTNSMPFTRTTSCCVIPYGGKTCIGEMSGCKIRALDGHCPRRLEVRRVWWLYYSTKFSGCARRIFTSVTAPYPRSA